MSVLEICGPYPVSFAHPSKAAIRRVAIGILVVMATGLAALLCSPHDPNECRYGEPPHIEISDAPMLQPPLIGQIASPTIADTLDRCQVKITTGNFKLK
jgi:hypothetical protein